MEVIRYIVAIVAALYTAAVAVGGIQELGKHQGVRGTTQMFAALGVTLACLVVTVWLFKWAIGGNQTTDDP